jgi:hypothetical protein
MSCNGDDDDDEAGAINNDVGGVIFLMNDARREKVLVTATRPSADDALPPITAVRHTAVAVFIQ